VAVRDLFRVSSRPSEDDLLFLGRSIFSTAAATSVGLLIFDTSLPLRIGLVSLESLAFVAWLGKIAQYNELFAVEARQVGVDGFLQKNPVDLKKGQLRKEESLEEEKVPFQRAPMNPNGITAKRKQWLREQRALQLQLKSAQLPSSEINLALQEKSNEF
jgi:hypothetical protein